MNSNSKKNLDVLKMPVCECTIDTVQDFLIESDMKPLMCLVEVSIFSQYNVTVTPTKIMNRANKNWAHF